MSKLKEMTERDNKAELALLYKMETLKSQGAKREFAEEIGIEWEEYLRLCSKWKRVLERYRSEQKTTE